MKHQWNREDVHIEDMKVIFCAACASSARVSSGLVGVATVVSECSATETTETSTTDSTVALELVSPDVLTQITEDLWVNPSAVEVVRVGRREKGFSQGYDFEDDPTASIVQAGGQSHHVKMPLHVVVALINGSA